MDTRFDNNSTGKHDGIKLYLVERVPYYTVPKWDAALKDVRKVHFGTKKEYKCISTQGVSLLG